MEAFDLINPWKAFDYRNVHFATFSTEYSLGFNETQYNWLEDDLLKATNNGTYLNGWIVIFFHQVGYTSKATHERVESIAKFFHPLFEKFGVDLILQGHIHFYERTYPILAGNNTTLPTVTNFNRSIHDSPEGQIFVIVGTGGKVCSITKTNHIS